jgi:cytochrome c oxidase subunit 2
MTPEIVFVPTREGTFEIACTELCGLGHYRMQGFFHVLSADEFRSWLQQQR